MKNRYIILSITIVVTSVALIFTRKDQNTIKYRPRIEKVELSANGAASYLNWMRANSETKTIDIKDVLEAQKQYSIMPKRKSASAWNFRGPDNIGGRTRALLIDKDNSGIMYAGGVSGGLWKSTSYGQYWSQIRYDGLDDEDFENLNISCITQAKNGDIYFGTGEGFASGGDYGYSGFSGNGIWKSSNGGVTFEKLSSTVVTNSDDDFEEVFEITADPTNENTVYAGTKGGLKVSKDAGDTWENVMLDEGLNAYNGHDVAVSEDGVVVASIANKCYVKKADSDVFYLRTGLDDEQGGDLITGSNVIRLEFAFAPSDPNYVYCIAAASSGMLRKIYQSKDAGQTWFTIGKGGSEFFNPLGSQGFYDMVVGVNQTNKEIIYVAGLDLYEGKAVATGNLFEWTQLTQWYLESSSEYYMHADIHAIVFDSKSPNTFFTGTDGGISRGVIDNETYQFRVMNNGYGVTQYYGVSANSKGHMLGGTQDNGSLLIDGTGNTKRNAKEVKGGDGGHSVMSDIVPSAAFATTYYGGLERNVDAAYGDWNEFYSSDIINLHWGAFGAWPGSLYSNEASFITPITYWETDYDALGTDTIEFIARRDYYVGVEEIFPSENIVGAPIKLTIQENEDPTYPDSIGYKEGDTIFYHDPYGSLFALGMARTVWITRKASSFVQPDNDDWWMAIELGVLEGSLDAANSDGMETTMQIIFSADGDNLFIATNYGNLFRLSNIKHARDKETGCAISDADNVVTEITKIAKFSSRSITGLAVGPKNSDQLVVTLGNYGSSRYVYYTDKATKLGSNSGTSNFIDITDNLPNAPAYCAVIEQSDPDGKILVGTELGVFMADNLFEQASSTLTWEVFNDGLAPVPVFQMEQTVDKGVWTSENNGMLYIGTHGQGFFDNGNFRIVGVNDDKQPFASKSLKINANVFPNPVIDIVNVNYSLQASGDVNVYLYNISGKLIEVIDKGRQFAGAEKNVQINMNSLSSGTYLVSIVSGSAKISKRIIKN